MLFHYDPKGHMMNIIEKLVAPIRNKIGSFTAGNLVAVEQKVLALPRVLQALRREMVVDLLRQWSLTAVSSGIVLARGKSLAIGVKDARLTKTGRVSNVIGLVASVVVIAVTAHDLWARKRADQAFLEQATDLLSRAHRDSHAGSVSVFDRENVKIHNIG